MATTEKKARVVSTVFNNKSGCDITTGVMRLIGVKDDYHFALESIVSNEDNTNNVKSIIKMTFNLNDMFKRADEYGFNEKVGNKLRVKFGKYPNLQISGEANNSFMSFMWENVEFLTSAKVAIKYEKSIGKVTRTLSSIAAYLEKMVAKKMERQRKSAEKKAAKAAAAKQSAESIPGAVAADASVTGA